jgi:hypothetical protein
MDMYEPSIGYPQTHWQSQSYQDARGGRSDLGRRHR